MQAEVRAIDGVQAEIRAIDGGGQGQLGLTVNTKGSGEGVAGTCVYREKPVGTSRSDVKRGARATDSPVGASRSRQPSFGARVGENLENSQRRA